MLGRIIEAIVLLLGLVATAFVVIAIPMKSYNEYKDYLAQIEQQNEENKQQQVKPVLESITVTLKEGVKYYANDMAEARAEHFTVVANYTKGEESYSEPVEEGKFSVKTAANFYSVGGDITISYRGATATVTVELVPVVLESISVEVAPYTVNYAAGATFDDAGMIIRANYNDGSSKILSAEEYSVDKETPLTTADNKVTVSYGSGENVKTVSVEINVSDVLDNGAVETIVIVNNAIVNAGDPITAAMMEVNAIYENGNRVALSAEEYTISGFDGALEFGKTYQLTVSYNADPTKIAKTDVIVRQTVQGEDGVIVGGKKNTETEYVVIDGVITETENKVSFAGNFSKAVLNGQEASLTLTVVSAAETIGDITMRCSNSYNVYANGYNADAGYMMQPLQINTILDLTINGKEVQVPATVILKGCGPYETYAPLYGIYYEFTFEDVHLDAGVNNVEFKFKKSTVGAANCWGESPSTLNIDYVHFDTLGSEIPDDYTIESIEISDQLTLSYAQRLDSLEVPVVATISNGSKIGLDPSLVDVEIIGGKEGDEIFMFGTYTIKASLKSNPSITATKDVVIEEYEHFAVLYAGVELVGDRVYYVFSGDSVGYTAEDLVFFDNATNFEIIDVQFTATTFSFKIDVTDLDVGTQINPHLKVGGMNYQNGANSNGDIRDNGLSYTDGQKVILGSKTYSIKTAWSMPALVISEYVEVKPSGYDADIDNSYSSDKVLIGEYVYGSEGVTTNGRDKNSEYAGGIGNLDALDAYVTYTFTLTEAGKVDFIWNIAGSYWNGSGNNGLTNAGDNLIVTINGNSVDMDGIALPAGDGTNTSTWWNIQQVVIKDVELEAGTHEFKCVVTTAGQGINAGAMKIYSGTKTVEHVHELTIVDEVAATCTESGVKAYYTCSGCDKLFADAEGENEIASPETIDALGHSEEVVAGKPAGCLESGLTDGKKCSACGITLVAQEKIEASGHQYDNDLDESCNNCGEIRNVECPHNNEETLAGKVATCTESGISEGKKCLDCGTVTVPQMEIDALGHSEEVVAGKAATCTEAGLTDGSICSACGITLKAQEEISATGHATDYVVVDGKFYYTCNNNCGIQEEISVTDSYDAALDNEFASDKDNTLNLVFAPGGAWGIATNGSHKVEVANGSPESGAIGGLDAAGKYVYYEFVMSEAGVVDFIWNIAGSNWDGSGNAGLEDMAAHMTVTIDGKPVDVSGIALTAEGDYPWWNLQNVVVKNVALEAGVHTFRCNITAAGGLNVGSMTVVSSESTSVRSADITNAKVSVEGDKVYYVFTLTHSGYTKDELKFWHDSSTSYEIASFETVDGVTTLKIDVTDLAVGTQINPHLSFADINYANGSNKNGDVCGGNLVYNQESINVGDKCYLIFTNYSMPSLSVCENFMKIQGADIYEEDGKVYYTLTYLVANYDPSTFEFFDGNTIYEVESYSADGALVTFKFNITDKDAGFTLWPHLRVNGNKWDGANNTSSSNGDVKVSATTETITLNGKTYTLKVQYSMPTVVVATA